MEELLVKSLPTATAEGRKGRWQLFGESFPFRMAVVDSWFPRPDYGAFFALTNESRGAYLAKLIALKVCNFDLYRPIWAVHTGPPGYQYADHSLPDSTAKIDRRRSIEGEI
ncbi:hypothetical protein BHE74_00018092 [Ensete ventricosum]|nr:hypothetical protein BHE74_00018092 [Ensete ventricosum]